MQKDSPLAKPEQFRNSLHNTSLFDDVNKVIDCLPALLTKGEEKNHLQTLDCQIDAAAPTEAIQRQA
jgi:hypothetical protein